ncbi:MAG: hypothetical protein ACR2H0_09300 [Candidatus Limnocylindrales bacterium]
MKRREGVDPCPRGPEQCADESHPDPAVLPEEERRDIAISGAAEQRLRDDPDPRHDADGREQRAQPAWQRSRTRRFQRG